VDPDHGLGRPEHLLTGFDFDATQAALAVGEEGLSAGVVPSEIAARPSEGRHAPELGLELGIAAPADLRQERPPGGEVTFCCVFEESPSVHGVSSLFTLKFWVLCEDVVREAHIKSE